MNSLAYQAFVPVQSHLVWFTKQIICCTLKFSMLSSTKLSETGAAGCLVGYGSEYVYHLSEM